MRVITVVSAVLLAVFMPGTDVLAFGPDDLNIHEIISVHPGESQIREFSVADVFELRRFGPIEGFIVYSWGYSVSAGELTVTLELLEPAEPFVYDDGALTLLVGAGYSVSGLPGVLFGRQILPGSISASVSINSPLGLYYIGVLVTRLEGAARMPLPYRITFAVSEADEESTGTD